MVEARVEACPVLGLSWNPQKDTLSIHGSFFEDISMDNLVVTKRQILSMAQRVFDPVGFVTPATLTPKVLLQKLWEKNLSWDAPVDDDTTIKFKRWASELPSLLSIEIPRWIMAGVGESQNDSLHTFCDASKDAYACVIFLRTVRDGQVSVFLVASKSRVAPLRKSGSKMTIPRLELLAATIGARLYSSLSANLEQKIPAYFWSDSSTVVSWIQRREEWGVFVWNRVKEIRDLTAPEDWRHLPGSLNPADLPSRGCSPKELLELRWWEGPSWLYEDPLAWPSTTDNANEEEINLERRKKLVTTLSNLEQSSFWHFGYFSRFTKTVRMFGWILRFLHNCRRPSSKQTGELSAEEYNVAETSVLKLVQHECFSGVEDRRISSLKPFFDNKGLLRLESRVSSRLQDTESYRFPIVMPSKHILTRSLIMDIHLRSCHVGTQGLLSILSRDSKMRTS